MDKIPAEFQIYLFFLGHFNHGTKIRAVNSTPGNLSHQEKCLDQKEI